MVTVVAAGVLPSDAASALLAPQVQDDDNDTIQATSERYAGLSPTKHWAGHHFAGVDVTAL